MGERHQFALAGNGYRPSRPGGKKQVDRPDQRALLDGPLVLAGLVGEERTLYGDLSDPDSLLIPGQEWHHGWWNTWFYRTVGQDPGFRFVPICEVRDEVYGVYFPVRKAERSA